MMFADQSNFFAMRAHSRELFIDILDQVVAKKDQVRDMKHLRTKLYSRAYGRGSGKRLTESGADLQGLI